MRAKDAAPVLFPGGQEALPHAGSAGRDGEARISLAVRMPAARAGPVHREPARSRSARRAMTTPGYPAPGRHGAHGQIMTRCLAARRSGDSAT